MTAPFSAINWFGIPVTDLDRALTFYETLLGKKLGEMPTPEGTVLHVFTNDDGEPMGGLDTQGHDKPGGETGPRVFFHAGPDLAALLTRVEPAGGKILSDKMDISPYGFIATIEDSEGNHISLHNMEG